MASTPTGVGLAALTSKLVKLELTTQLSADQVGHLFQAIDANSDVVELESFLAVATAIQTLLGAVMNDAMAALVEKNCAAIAAERQKAQIMVGQALLDGGSKPAGGSGAKAAQLLSAGAEAKAEEAHEAPLPPALAAWDPIGKVAAVKEAAAGHKELEAAFARQPSGEAAEALRAKTDKIDAAMRSVIDQRVTEDKIVPRCDAAIQAGTDAFTAVYDAVAQSIESMEAEGMKALRAELSDQRLAERVGRGGAKAKQTKTGLMEVYADAAAARPLATEVIARAAAACGVEKAAQPPLKATLRMLEKALLRPGASRGLCDTVCDCVRDMLTVKDAAQLALLVRALLDEEAIVVVRVKDRFKHPSGGGWRDVMVNFYVVSDGAKHVCEVQLVHKSLLTARKGLPGHIIYGVVRNATEVLEFLGLLIKFEREAGLRALVSAGWGREAIERLGLPPPVLALEGHSGRVLSVCVTPDGLHVVTGSWDMTARVWLLADGSLVRTLEALEGHSQGVMSVCVTPDSLHVVTGSNDRTARVWLLADGSLVRTLEGHTQAVWSVCVTPDGLHVVTGSRDETARVWRLADGSLVRTLQVRSGGVNSVCVTPDGLHVVTGSGRDTAHVWRLADGSLVRTLEGHSGGVNSVCVTPDSLHVVTGSRDETARVWLLADGSLVRTLKGHSHYVNSVCVTPDGLHVVTGSKDKTARVWRLADGTLVRTLEGHSADVNSVCVTADGQRVITGSDDKTARVCLL